MFAAAGLTSDVDVHAQVRAFADRERFHGGHASLDPDALARGSADTEAPGRRVGGDLRSDGDRIERAGPQSRSGVPLRNMKRSALRLTPERNRP